MKIPKILPIIKKKKNWHHPLTTFVNKNFTIFHRSLTPILAISHSHDRISSLKIKFGFNQQIFDQISLTAKFNQALTEILVFRVNEIYATCTFVQRQLLSFVSSNNSPICWLVTCFLTISVCSISLDKHCGGGRGGESQRTGRVSLKWWRKRQLARLYGVANYTELALLAR